MKRDFVSLTAQEALHVAIFIEERNAEIYHQFAEMFAEFHEPESLEIASTFWDMANEERQHGTLLRKRYFDRYGTRPCAVTDQPTSGKCHRVRPGMVKVAGSAMQPVKNSTPNQTRVALHPTLLVQDRR